MFENHKFLIFQEKTFDFIIKLPAISTLILLINSGNVNPLDNLDNYITGNMKVSLGSYLNNLSLRPRAMLGHHFLDLEDI